MFIYLIIFSYYIFLCSVIFHLIRSRSHRRTGKNKDYSGKKKFFEAIINKMNLFSFRIGRFLISRHWFVVKKESKELLRLLENENKITLTPDTFMGYKVIFFVLFFTAGSLSGSSLIGSGLLGIITGVTGYFVPNLLLGNFRKVRKNEIERDLPYVVDLLAVATLSGQNIYNAIKVVIEKYKGIICKELSNFIKDVDICICKLQAYRNLMDRSSSEDFKSFIFLLIQAERYGSSINEILKQKSKYMKFETCQNMERKTR